MDFVLDHFRQIGKEKVSLIEKKDQLGLFRIAHLRQLFKKLAQQPQQEGGIEFGRIDQFVRGQDIDYAMALGIGLDQVVEVERRFA